VALTHVVDLPVARRELSEGNVTSQLALNIPDRLPRGDPARGARP
jgi:hypothetical protein